MGLTREHDTIMVNLANILGVINPNAIGTTSAQTNIAGSPTATEAQESVF